MRTILALLSLVVASCATPSFDGDPLLVSVREERVGAKAYRVVVSQNGVTPGAELKPRVLKRARELGRISGYASFVMGAPDVSYHPQGGGYSARVLVNYFLPDEAAPTGHYLSSDPDEYKQELPKGQAASLARVESTKWWDSKLNVGFGATPVYLDAVSSAMNKWDGSSHAYVKPGTHVVLARALVSFGEYTFVQLQGDLKSGRSYALTGTFDDDTMRLWIEDTESKQVTGPVVSLFVGRPDWVKPTSK